MGGLVNQPTIEKKDGDEFHCLTGHFGLLYQLQHFDVSLIKRGARKK